MSPHDIALRILDTCQPRGHHVLWVARLSDAVRRCGTVAEAVEAIQEAAASGRDHVKLGRLLSWIQEGMAP